MLEKKKIFTCLFPVTLTFRHHVCSSIVTLVQRYVFTKLEVSTAFLFQENWRHVKDGQTDSFVIEYAILRGLLD